MVDRAYAENRLGALRVAVERDLPGSIVEFEPFPGVDSQVGFGVAYAGGLTLAWTDLTADPWWLMVDGCVAPGLANLDVPLGWVNEKNTKALFGKYFCHMNREQGRAGIFYEFSLPGYILEKATDDALNKGEPFMLNWVAVGVMTVAQTTAREGEALHNAHGGARFEATTEHLTYLSMMLMG